MLSIFSDEKTRGGRGWVQLVSLAAHASLLLLLVGGVRLHRSQVAPFRLPGTKMGMTVLTYYSPGSPQHVVSDKPLEHVEKPKPELAKRVAVEAPHVEQSQAAPSEAGAGTAEKSGIGEGDITIALQTYFPYPKPDLSGLPHGTRGDVILNAVIDEHGKISELKLLKGLGSPVDETVIATVEQWQYTPAMKNGVPVVSEQELHFHYERG